MRELLVVAFVVFWGLVAMVTYAATHAPGRTKPHRCCRCVRGSRTANDALPLSMLQGEEGMVLIEALGADPNEYWCPHCVHFALDVLSRARGVC